MTLLMLTSIGVAAIVFIRMLERHSARREAELREACSLLRRHFAAAERIMESDEVSIELKHHVLAFSFSVTDGRLAKPTARAIMRNEQHRLPRQLKKHFAEVRSELKSLRDRQSGIVSDFVEMSATGFASMTRRWPVTRPALEKLGDRDDVQHSIDAAETIAKADPERFQRLERGELLPA